MINLERYGDAAALVGRLSFSSMFLAFSYGKLTAFGGTSGYMGSPGLPAPALFTLLAIIIEIGGGLLMLVGYQTRLVALGLALYVLASAFIGHSQLGDPNQFMHFMKKMAIVGWFAGVCCFRCWRNGREAPRGIRRPKHVIAGRRRVA